MRLGLLQVKLADQFVRAYRQGRVVHWQAGSGWLARDLRPGRGGRSPTGAALTGRPSVAGCRRSCGCCSFPPGTGWRGQAGAGCGCDCHLPGSGLPRQCAGSPKWEGAAVGEPGDGADLVAAQGQDDHPVGPGDRGLGGGQVAAEGGLGAGPGGHQSQRGTAQGGMVSQASLVSRVSTASMSPSSTAPARGAASAACRSPAAPIRPW
jgi:hypothetical protein